VERFVGHGIGTMYHSEPLILHHGVYLFLAPFHPTFLLTFSFHWVIIHMEFVLHVIRFSCFQFRCPKFQFCHFFLSLEQHRRAACHFIKKKKDTQFYHLLLGTFAYLAWQDVVVSSLLICKINVFLARWKHVYFPENWQCCHQMHFVLFPRIVIDLTFCIYLKSSQY
jgi:hypothetical protein